MQIKPRVCLSCSEKNNPSFVKCWNCGASFLKEDVPIVGEEPLKKCLGCAKEIRDVASGCEHCNASLQGYKWMRIAGVVILIGAFVQACISEHVFHRPFELLVTPIGLFLAMGTRIPFWMGLGLEEAGRIKAKKMSKLLGKSRGNFQ